MELEVGLKITKTKENLSSSTSDLRIAKDAAGPVFFSRETENMFVLSAHLKGFKRERVKIDISKDRSCISISGSKPVQETVMMKWKVQKKQVEMKGFRKVFRIPDVVNVDMIKAKFNEKDPIISIFMPKLIVGIQGKDIEEVKQEGEEQSAAAPAPAASEEEDKSSSYDKTTCRPPSSTHPAPPAAELKQHHNQQPEITKQEDSGDRNVVEENKMEVPEAIEQVIEQVVIEERPPPLTDQMNKKDEVVEAESLMRTEEAEQKPTGRVEVEPHQELLPYQSDGDEMLLEDKQVVQKHDVPNAESSGADPETVGEMKFDLDGELSKEEIHGNVQEEEHMDRVEAPAEEQENVEEYDLQHGKEEPRRDERPSRWCNPCVFVGSAFIGFLIVLVVQLMKSSKLKKKY